MGIRQWILLIPAVLATGGCASVSQPANYSYEHTNPDGERCAIGVRSDRDIAALGIDITERCAVSLRAGTVSSENISDVIDSVPVGEILPIITNPLRVLR